MNIAVISNQETQLGTSCFIELLASVFARTQRQRVAILSTGDIKDMYEYVEIKDKASLLRSVSVFQTMVQSSIVSDEEIWDYGTRLGEEEVFAFDVKLNSITDELQIPVYEEALNRIKAVMKIIEVVGSLDNPLNKHILENANVILYVFPHAARPMKKVADYVKNGDPIYLKKMGFVCLKYDRNVIAEKAIANELGIDQKKLMSIPYNSTIPKECINGTLNTLSKYIAKGHMEVLNLRPALLAVMRFVYASKSKKIIKGENEWAQ